MNLKKYLLLFVLSLCAMIVFCQEEQSLSDMKLPPNFTEKVIEHINTRTLRDYAEYKDGDAIYKEHPEFVYVNKHGRRTKVMSHKYLELSDTYPKEKKYATEEEVYRIVLGYYRGYNKDNNNRKIRNLEYYLDEENEVRGGDYSHYTSQKDADRGNNCCYKCEYYYTANHYRYIISFDIVEPDIDVIKKIDFTNGINKVLENLPNNARIALDKIDITSDTERDVFTGSVLEILLDNGYKVVAKEYLEKLYEEQMNQQSGIYNENTTVTENNFSAVGYYLNIKIDDNRTNFQVVNVSTGEYESNISFRYTNSQSGDGVSLLDKSSYMENALSKASGNLRGGSRIALDVITVPEGVNKEDLKDFILEQLLNKNFKVVAKEYLARLYEEQQNQQSGIYNENTTVAENNFSAVGYYLNVKMTETTVRVQFVDVSTGEYAGISNVNF